MSMDSSLRAKDEQASELLGNAAAVITRLEQIDQVLQVAGHFKRNPMHAHARMHVTAEAPIAHASLDGGHVIVQVELSLTVSARDERETPPLFAENAAMLPPSQGVSELAAISATFVIIYSIKPGEPPTDADLAAFGRQNAVFNAWPYWREYVASVSARAGLPVLSVPILKLPAK